MCGIAGLQLRSDTYRDQLGELIAGMMCQLGERGPDSAGVALYGDTTLCPPGWSAVSLLAESADPEGIATTVMDKKVVTVGDVLVVTAPVPVGELVAAVLGTAGHGPVILGAGTDLAVLKGVGSPASLAESFGLASRSGYQAVAHTRMATESAVTVAHGHPFSAGANVCLVHNGSFANHETIRKQLRADGIECVTDNDSEVAAAFVGACLDSGDDLKQALRCVCETFDGFYTLLVTTGSEFAVVRDAIACKPALIAETPDWVAMVSEYRALLELPGAENAKVFEPGPEEVYVWPV
jgi:glutamate synthase domain-containing protein 1